jgi:S1-C subfamily serine protease
MRSRLFACLVTTALLPGLALAAAPPAQAPAASPAAKSYLGILVEPTAKDAARSGAMVRAVAPESPAARAGLMKGDLIIKVGARDVNDAKALVEAVGSHKVGEKVVLHVLRDGKEQTIEATLAERPGEKMPSFRGWPDQPRGHFLGVRAEDLTAEVKARLGVDVAKGAVVREVLPNTPAAKAGLQKDDVITAVNGKAVTNGEELRKAVQQADAGKDVTVKVLRGKEVKEFKVRLAALPPVFGWLQDFEKRWPMADGSFSFELPNLPPDLEKQFAELHQWLRQFEQGQEQQED